MEPRGGRIVFSGVRCADRNGLQSLVVLDEVPRDRDICNTESSGPAVKYDIWKAPM